MYLSSVMCDAVWFHVVSVYACRCVLVEIIEVVVAARGAKVSV